MFVFPRNLAKSIEIVCSTPLLLVFLAQLHPPPLPQARKSHLNYWNLAGKNQPAVLIPKQRFLSSCSIQKNHDHHKQQILDVVRIRYHLVAALAAPVFP